MGLGKHLYSLGPALTLFSNLGANPDVITTLVTRGWGSRWHGNWLDQEHLHGLRDDHRGGWMLAAGDAAGTVTVDLTDRGESGAVNRLRDAVITVQWPTRLMARREPVRPRSLHHACGGSLHLGRAHGVLA